MTHAGKVAIVEHVQQSASELQHDRVLQVAWGDVTGKASQFELVHHALLEEAQHLRKMDACTKALIEECAGAMGEATHWCTLGRFQQAR